jgi:hypothetical protein
MVWLKNRLFEKKSAKTIIWKKAMQKPQLVSDIWKKAWQKPQLVSDNIIIIVIN